MTKDLHHSRKPGRFKPSILMRLDIDQTHQENVGKKMPAGKRAKPKKGPRDENSEWCAAVIGQHTWLQSRISVACTADESSIGRQ
ncbi:MAG: hypothetical protein ACXWU9_05345, partial [Telluria sp.]